MFLEFQITRNIVFLKLDLFLSSGEGEGGTYSVGSTWTSD